MVLSPRAYLRHARRWLERSLHPGRRHRALETIRRAAPVRHVMVVCLGNICRSPYAEASLRRALLARNRDITVRSAGFIYPGRTPPDYAVQAAREKGIDLTGHVSRILAHGLLVPADLILVMSSEQEKQVARSFAPRAPIVVLGDLDPEVPAGRTIPDPIEGPLTMFLEVYERIDRCSATLAGALDEAATVA